MAEKSNTVGISELQDPFVRMVTAAFTGNIGDEQSKARFLEDASEVFPDLGLDADSLCFDSYSAQTHILRGLINLTRTRRIKATHKLAFAAGRKKNDYREVKDLLALRLLAGTASRPNLGGSEAAAVWTADDIAESKLILSGLATRILTQATKGQS